MIWAEFKPEIWADSAPRIWARGFRAQNLGRIPRPESGHGAAPRQPFWRDVDKLSGRLGAHGAVSHPCGYGVEIRSVDSVARVRFAAGDPTLDVRRASVARRLLALELRRDSTFRLHTSSSYLARLTSALSPACHSSMRPASQHHYRAVSRWMCVAPPSTVIGLKHRARCPTEPQLRRQTMFAMRAFARWLLAHASCPPTLDALYLRRSGA